MTSAEIRRKIHLTRIHWQEARTRKGDIKARLATGRVGPSIKLLPEDYVTYLIGDGESVRYGYFTNPQEYAGVRVDIQRVDINGKPV